MIRWGVGVMCVCACLTWSTISCAGGGYLSQAGGKLSSGAKSTGGSISSGFKQMTAGASATGQHIGAVASSTTKNAGKTISTNAKNGGRLLSSFSKNSGATFSSAYKDGQKLGTSAPGKITATASKIPSNAKIHPGSMTASSFVGDLKNAGTQLGNAVGRPVSIVGHRYENAVGKVAVKARNYIENREQPVINQFEQTETNIENDFKSFHGKGHRQPSQPNHSANPTAQQTPANSGQVHQNQSTNSSTPPVSAGSVAISTSPNDNPPITVSPASSGQNPTVVGNSASPSQGANNVAVSGVGLTDSGSSIAPQRSADLGHVVRRSAGALQGNGQSESQRSNSAQFHLDRANEALKAPSLRTAVTLKNPKNSRAGTSWDQVQARPADGSTSAPEGSK